MLNSKRLAEWRDPIKFIEHVLIDPETKKPFVLYTEQKTFLQHAFEFGPEGKMRRTELCYSGPKKLGKIGLAAMIVIYTAVVLAGQGGEINLLANDLDQSQSRVFRAIGNIVQASPMLRDSVDITANRIVFRSTGTVISALASDYAGFSGGNPTLNVYDELAYYSSASARRLWDEGVPSPARKISFRLSVSTAGFDGEPSPLRDLHDRAMKDGTEIAPDLRVLENLLCFWTHQCRAPWQSAAWVSEMKRTLRPSQFARLILNEWVPSEAGAIDMQQWDRCTDPELKPLLAKSGLPIWAALDLGLKHDSTALCAVAWEGDRVRVVTHQVFTARAGETLDLESTAEGDHELAIVFLLAVRVLRSLAGSRLDPAVATRRHQRRRIPADPAELGRDGEQPDRLIEDGHAAALPGPRVATSSREDDHDRKLARAEAWQGQAVRSRRPDNCARDGGARLRPGRAYGSNAGGSRVSAPRPASDSCERVRTARRLRSRARTQHPRYELASVHRFCRTRRRGPSKQFGEVAV
jgi:hypothetical protein